MPNAVIKSIYCKGDIIMSMNDKNKNEDEQFEQLKFDFSKDVVPNNDSKQAKAPVKSHADYEFEAAVYQAKHPVKPTKPTSYHELNADNRDLVSDEELSDMILHESEDMEDLREQWAEERAAKKAEKKAEPQKAESKVDYSKLDGAPKPKNDGHMPAGYTNTFPTDEKGNMYDDGYSFDEKE
jgi:hypothetical protein